MNTLLFLGNLGATEVIIILIILILIFAFPIWAITKISTLKNEIKNLNRIIEMSKENRR